MIFFLAAYLITSASAEIRQAPTMFDALSDVDSQTLTIFDLDNTVMMPPQSLGGEEWYDYFVEKRKKEFEAKGMKPDTAKSAAIDQGLKEWNQFHRNAKVVPVEKKTPELINGIQSKGTRTMGLTARPIDLATSTAAQLKSIGIEMGRNTVSRKSLKVPGTNPSLFTDGILFVGPKNNKGEVLVKFLNHIGLKPKKIVFIDNKMHHNENVEKALQPTGIPFFGRRHGAADEKISSMDKEIVEIQHRYFFGDVLSNKQAELLK